jgi:hypothetical protein
LSIIGPEPLFCRPFVFAIDDVSFDYFRRDKGNSGSASFKNESAKQFINIGRISVLISTHTYFEGEENIRDKWKQIEGKKG